MSLDVWLSDPDKNTDPIKRTGIFIREDGQTREISREEWDAKFPNTVPVTAEIETNHLYSNNITHNLNSMAMLADLYEPLWRPDEIGITKAKQLIAPLTEGLARLEAEPDRYKALNPLNGWGNYEGLVWFVRRYLEACKKYPDADVNVNR